MQLPMPAVDASVCPVLPPAATPRPAASSPSSAGARGGVDAAQAPSRGSLVVRLQWPRSEQPLVSVPEAGPSKPAALPTPPRFGGAQEQSPGPSAAVAAKGGDAAPIPVAEPSARVSTGAGSGPAPASQLAQPPQPRLQAPLPAGSEARPAALNPARTPAAGGTEPALPCKPASEPAAPVRPAVAERPSPPPATAAKSIPVLGQKRRASVESCTVVRGPGDAMDAAEGPPRKRSVPAFVPAAAVAAATQPSPLRSPPVAAVVGAGVVQVAVPEPSPLVAIAMQLSKAAHAMGKTPSDPFQRPAPKVAVVGPKAGHPVAAKPAGVTPNTVPASTSGAGPAAVGAGAPAAQTSLPSLAISDIGEYTTS